MKLTAVQLRRLIKEEVTKALGEAKMPDMKEKLASVFEEFGLDVSKDTLEQIMDLAQSETDPDLDRPLSSKHGAGVVTKRSFDPRASSGEYEYDPEF
jgi:hypothetical protein